MPTTTSKAYASQRQQLWEVKPFRGFFATKTGGDVSAEPTKVYEGGRKKPLNLSAPSETDNITLTRPYKPGEHAEILRQWEQAVGSLVTTVTGWDTDPDLGRLSTPSHVYAEALLVKLTWPEHDASSNDPGMVTVEFAVDNG